MDISIKNAPVRYLVELTGRNIWDPRFALSTSFSNQVESGVVCYFDTGVPEELTYWKIWGGGYSDVPTSTRLQIYFAGFLSVVTSFAALIEKERSFWVDGSRIYCHIERYPWQYANGSTSVRESLGFATDVVDYRKKSDDTISGERYEVRLKVPTNITQKIPDPSGGIVFSKTFSLTLDNHDGLFDSGLFFNTPVILKKSSVEYPEYSDFVTIKTGLYENGFVKKTSFKITVADVLRTLTNPVNDVITLDEYPASGDSAGKNIPLAWGVITGAPLISVGTDQYLCCAPDYLTSVETVYDTNGDPIVPFTVTDGVISTAVEAKSADFTGRDSNRIGDIIIDIVSNRANFPFVEGVWDVTDVTGYLESSFRINYLVSSGTVQKLVNDVTANDTSVFFVKNNGLMTLRRWGDRYETHTIPTYLRIVLKSKTYTSYDDFASSVDVNYGYDYGSKEYLKNELDDSREQEIEREYLKVQRRTFDTDLASKDDAVSFASRLLARWSVRAEIISVDEGVDTSLINVFDTVIQPAVVNGRVMSTFTMWVATQVNPAQDMLVLEQLGRETGYSGDMYQPSNEDQAGIMYQPSIENQSGVLYSPSEVITG